MKKDNGHFTAVTSLCQNVVSQQEERLLSIEEYLTKYGYVSPDAYSRQIDENDHANKGNNNTS